MLTHNTSARMSWADSVEAEASPSKHSKALDAELDNSRDGINVAFTKSLKLTGASKDSTAAEAEAEAGAGAGVGAGSDARASQFGSLARDLFGAGRADDDVPLRRSESAPAEGTGQRKRDAEEMMVSVSGSPASPTSPSMLPAGEKKRRLEGSPKAVVSSPAMLTRSKSVCEALTPKRLEKRQRQIDIGKETEGYKNFVKLVPKHKRKNRMYPSLPDKSLQCSKRSWDGQVRKWRRQLHKWDPKPDGSPCDALLELRSTRKHSRARSSSTSSRATAATPSTPKPRIPMPNLRAADFPALAVSSSSSSPVPASPVWGSPDARRVVEGFSKPSPAAPSPQAAVATPAAKPQTAAAASVVHPPSCLA